MGHRQELRYLPPEYGQAVASRLAYLVGTASSFRGRRDHLSRAAGDLPLSERAGAEISHVPNVLHGKPHRGWAAFAGYPAEHDQDDGRLPCVETAGDSRKLPAAHAPARESDVHGSDLAGWQHADAQLRGSFQFCLDDELHL